jgi:hypothetical protein
MFEADWQLAITVIRHFTTIPQIGDIALESEDHDGGTAEAGSASSESSSRPPEEEKCMKPLGAAVDRD